MKIIYKFQNQTNFYEPIRMGDEKHFTISTGFIYQLDLLSYIKKQLYVLYE